jgi:putative spermidine/putrescine transport system ATP-binding protein
MKHDFSELRLDHVTRRFAAPAAGVQRARRADAHREARRVHRAAGASGCGKSTALNCIAGLMQPPGGTIWLDDARIDTLPPERRGFGMVFQNYALFRT